MRRTSMPPLCTMRRTFIGRICTMRRTWGCSLCGRQCAPNAKARKGSAAYLSDAEPCPPSAMMPKWKSPCNGLGADKILEFKKPLFGQIGLAFRRLAFGGALVRGQLRILPVHLQIWESESEGAIPNLAFGGMPSSSCSCSFRSKRRLRAWRRGLRGRFRAARRGGSCPQRTSHRPSGRS